MENMTVKELAEVAGASTASIRRTAKKFFPENTKNGKKAYFNKEQSLKIIEKVKKRNMIQPLQNEKLPLQNEKVDYEAIGKMIGMAVTAALTPVVTELKELSNQKALPEPIKDSHISLTAYCIQKGFKLEFPEAVMHGKQLTKLSKEKGIETIKIPDNRYGFVNGYHLSVLYEHFSL